MPAFAPYGASTTIEVSQTSQAVAIPTMPSGTPAIALVSRQASIGALYIKFGDSGASVTRDDGMRVFAGTPEAPSVIGVSSGETHVAIICDGDPGKVTLTAGSLPESGASPGAVTASFALTGDITPSQITADQNDYSPSGLSTATVLRLSSDASRNITGLAGGSDGRIIIIHNVGAQNIVLKDESASSSAGNRFALTADLTLNADSVSVLQYDSTSSRWRAVGGSTLTTPISVANGGTGQTTEAEALGEMIQALSVDATPDVTADYVPSYDASADTGKKILINQIFDGRACLVYKSGSAQAITTSTTTTVSFDAEQFDDAAMHDNSTNNTRLTVPTGATRVQLVCRVTYAANSSGSRYVGFVKNGSSAFAGAPSMVQLPGSNSWEFGVTSPVLDVTGGDYFEMWVWHNVGANLNVNNSATGTSTWAAMMVIR